MQVATIETLDAAGNVTSAERTVYDYDVNGQRVRSETDADFNGTFAADTTTEYLNDPENPTGYSQVLVETTRDSSNTITDRRVYTLGHDVIAQTKFTPAGPTAGETLILLYDGRSSTRFVADLNAAIAQAYSYDAYGNALNFEPAAALTNLLYSGEAFDAKIGRQYLRARWYDASTGRFNRLDPFFGNLDDPQSLHKYLYTHADPVNGIDPTGLVTLGSLGVGMSGSFNARSQNAAAQLKVYKNVRTALKALSRIYSKAEKAWDWVNAARDAIDLFQFDPADLKQLEGAIKGKLFDGTKFSGKAEIDLPKPILRKFKKILGPFKKAIEVQTVQEWLGVISSVLVAKSLGFESTAIGVSYRGIDGLLWDPLFDRFVIVEAKGGSSTLKGNQMRDKWITPRLRRLADKYRNTPDGDKLDTAVRNRDKMWAMVVKLDLGKKDPKIAVRIQTYPGVRAWGRPF